MRTANAWNLNTAPENRSCHAWQGGHLEIGKRSHTDSVEGRIISHNHLCMVTLSGGAKQHHFKTEDGLRYSGLDRPGTASFLPAGCERRLALKEVAWEWGVIAITPNALPALRELPASIGPEPFLFGLMGQMRALLEQDGALDETYCSTLSLALSEFLLGRSRILQALDAPPKRLSPAHLRRTLERIDSLLSGPIRISDLSAPLDLSDGHFHRAFKGATGKTPLQVISERRVERASALLCHTNLSVSEIAFDVGFVSQSHLARMFRTVLQTTPSSYRRAFRPLTQKKGQDRAK